MLNAWKVRFEQNKNRHPGVAWETVEALLLQDDAKLRAAEQMENSGGEPDVIAFGGRLLLCDCAEESPRKRSSLCYDGAARLSRKKNAPASSAVQETEKMGVRLMTEEEYRYLQTLGAYDMKTSTGCRRRSVFARSAAPFSVSADMTRFSLSTTERTPITVYAGFAAYWN